MPDASPRNYSLSEIAQIIGVDEKQLHLYAHKGFIDPVFSTDSAARFTAIDCARLMIIKRAHQLSYEPENLFNLIGHPDQVLSASDPLAACQQFAMEKYKQLYDELGHCEPLEQLNKQCDLKLVTAYIKHLKDVQNHVSPKGQEPKAAAQAAPRPAVEGGQVRPGASKPTSKPSPSVGSYSVAKLWDYMKKVEQRQKGPHSKSKRSGAGLQGKSQPGGTGDRASTEPPTKTPLSSSSVQRYFNAKFRTASAERLTAGVQRMRKTLTKPVWTVCIGAGLLIIMFAVTGYFLLSGYPDEADRKPAIVEKSDSQSVADAKAPGREPVSEPEPSPGQRAAEEQRATEPIQSEKEQTSGQPPEVVAQSSRGSIQDAPDKAASNNPQTETGSKITIADQQSVPVQAAVAPSIEPEASAGTKSPDSKPAARVQVEDLRLWHDSLNNIYRADFTIRNNNTAYDREPLTGYLFVHLGASDEASDGIGLLMPSGELHSGKPGQVRDGARFSIRNLIQMRVTAVSTLPPAELNTGTVMVYSPEGDLLLEKPFQVPIQPFFSAVEERPATPDDQNAAPAASTDAAFAQLESQRTAGLEPGAPKMPALSTPPRTDNSGPSPIENSEKGFANQEVPPPPPAEAQAQTPVLQATGTLPQIDKTETAPLAKPEATSTAGIQPQVPEDIQGPAEIAKPVARIRKTNHPDAPIWEQKSYNAAVRGDFGQAIADATKAIELDPGRVNAYINRSWAYIEKDLLHKAIEDCNTVLSIDPQNAFAHNNLGLAHQRRGQIQTARNDYRRACELGFDLGCQNLEAIVNQARVAELIDQSQNAFKTQDWDGVIRATTAVINLDSQNAVAYANRSAAYAQKNFLNKALKDSNEAIKYNPDFPLAYNNRGYVFELLGSNKKAASDYLKSCSLGLDLGCKNFEALNRRQ